jgi:hypothetical protein
VNSGNRFLPLLQKKSLPGSDSSLSRVLPPHISRSSSIVSMAGADTFKDIDARIRKLRREIRGLATRRNALTGLCRLPPEIIVHIISLLPVVNLPPEDNFHHSRTSYNAKWTRMTRVCVHLRNIALGAGVLWSVVPIKPSPKDAWTKQCLERAGKSTLGLFLASSRYRWKEGELAAAADIITDAMPRCHALNLELGHSYHWQHSEDFDFGHVLDLEAPLLRSLCMSSSSSEYSLAITRQFLGGNATGLRRLFLDTPLTINDPPALPCVEVLELELSGLSTIAAVGQLLDLLERAPLAEELILRRTIPAYRRHAEPSIDATVRLVYADRAPVALAHLRVLCVAEHIAPLALLLRVLPLPREALHVKAIAAGAAGHWAPPGDAAYDAVFAHLSAFWHAHAGENDLPGGTLTAHTSRDADIPAGAANNLRFDGGPAFSFSCAARIAEAHAVVDLVTTLVLKGDRTGPGTAGTDLSGAAYMRNLQRVVVADPWTAVHLQGVERWLKQHKKAYGPLVHVEICDPGHKIKDKTDEMIARIRKLELAEDVVLVHRPPSTRNPRAIL